MANVEFGKGRGGMDILNVSGINNCDINCPFRGEGNGKFRCMSHNGRAEVMVKGGMTRFTIEEFTNAKPGCLQS